MNTIRDNARDLSDFSVMSSSSRLILEDRSKLSVTGVRDIDSFDENQITMLTDAGLMSIHGEGLKINKLSVDTGDVDIEGRVWAIEYSDDEEPVRRRGFLSKIFG